MLFAIHMYLYVVVKIANSAIFRDLCDGRSLVDSWPWNHFILLLLLLASCGVNFFFYFCQRQAAATVENVFSELLNVNKIS
jgi:hypothetical protein